MTVALTDANLQIGAIGFRTLLRTIEMFLSVAGKPDLTTPSLKVVSNYFIGPEEFR